MILKEAYRHQNNLDNLIAKATRILLFPEFCTVTIEEHMKNKVNHDVQNEIVQVAPNVTYSFTPNDLINLIASLIDEKQKLTDAIATAKKNAEIDIDSSAAMNKIRQDFIKNLKALDIMRSCERKKSGTDYRFNVNNEQVPYRYDVIEKVGINFDRNDVRGLIKKNSNISDNISNKIEFIQLTLEVNYTPKYDFDMDLEDAVKVA